jgi:hypothetical protein
MSDHLTAAEAAKLLGCSETLIRNRLTAGTLPGEKVLGRWHILREDIEAQSKPHASSQPNRTVPPNHTTTPHNQTAQSQGHAPEPHNESAPHNQTAAPEWRDDLLAQIARLEAREGALHGEVERREAGAAQREERAKARIIDLERELTVQGSRIADMQTAHDSRIADMQAARETEVSDLRGQVAILEAKVRETLEERAEEIGRLATSITELVGKQQEMQTRVYELEPVADQVPMLQAAVEEKGASLSERERELGAMRKDIETIASRPVTGPVFRLLTKGKLRR